MNVQLFPQSWNVYDSLGEAYANAGDTALAIQNYEKSVQLNPNNDTGKAALKTQRQVLILRRHLQGDRATELGIRGAKDLAHAAGANGGGDVVASQRAAN